MSLDSPFECWAGGRPAPQGSKTHGHAGQLREASAYLPAWRAAVKTAVYTRYRDLGIRPEQLPLYRGPVTLSLHFWLTSPPRIDGPPDLDKLVRAVCDALTAARLWEDDSRVTFLTARKFPADAPDAVTGVLIGAGASDITP